MDQTDSELWCCMYLSHYCRLKEIKMKLFIPCSLFTGWNCCWCFVLCPWLYHLCMNLFLAFSWLHTPCFCQWEFVTTLHFVQCLVIIFTTVVQCHCIQLRSCGLPWYYCFTLILEKKKRLWHFAFSVLFCASV